MIKVNLIGKRRRDSGKKNWLIMTFIVLFWVFVAYFLVSTIYVTYMLYSLKAEARTVARETEETSKAILSNDVLLRRYILSKFILGKIEAVNGSRFHYKDYLDQIVLLLPEGILLKSVDFSVANWVSVLVSSPNVKLIQLFEKTLVDPSFLAGGTFSSIYAENVVRSRSGEYDMKLQFEISKNGRK